MTDPTESESVKRLRVASIILASHGYSRDVDAVDQAASALSRAEQDIEALVKVARAARDTWREAEAIHDKGEFPTKYRAPYAGLVKVNDALASLPPHLAKRIKESGR